MRNLLLLTVFIPFGVSCSKNAPADKPVSKTKLEMQYTGDQFFGAAIRFTCTAHIADSVHWNFGDNTSSNELNPVHIFRGTGVYKIKLTTLTDSVIDSVQITLGASRMPLLKNWRKTVVCLTLIQHYPVVNTAEDRNIAMQLNVPDDNTIILPADSEWTPFQSETLHFTHVDYSALSMWYVGPVSTAIYSPANDSICITRYINSSTDTTHLEITITYKTIKP